MERLSQGFCKFCGGTSIPELQCNDLAEMCLDFRVVLTIFGEFKVVCALIEYSWLFACDGNRRLPVAGHLCISRQETLPLCPEILLFSSPARNDTITAHPLRCLPELRLSSERPLSSNPAF